MFQVQVEDRVNIFFESVDLALAAFRFKGKFKKKDFHLVENYEKFTFGKEEINKTYSDVISFQKNILSEANHLYEKYASLRLFLRNEKEEMYSSYLSDISKSSKCTEAGEMTLEAFLFMNFCAFFLSVFENGEVDEDLLLLNQGRYKNSYFSYEKAEYNMKDIFELVVKTPYKEDVKLEILKLYAEPERYYTDFKGLFLDCETILKKHYSLIEERVEKTKAYFRSVEGTQMLEDLFEMLDFREGFTRKIGKQNKHPLKLHVLSVNYNAGGFTGNLKETDDWELFFFMGILLVDLHTHKKTASRARGKMMERAKAIGDNTRFEILEHLKERPYFGKELAEKLGMSPASLSHHMNLLSTAGLLVFFWKDRKMYYEIHKENMRKFGEYIIKMTEEE